MTSRLAEGGGDQWVQPHLTFCYPLSVSHELVQWSLIDRVKNFLHVFQTAPLSLGVKQQGHEAYPSAPASAKIKKKWIYTSTPPCTFLA
jgi:hypothetical protein